MKYKVGDLEGALLDAAVAMADGETLAEREGLLWDMFPNCDEEGAAYHDDYDSGTRTAYDAYQPSTDWGRGGPIIERERIAVYAVGNEHNEHCWRAVKFGVLGYDGYDYIDVPQSSDTDDEPAFGKTPLIAAMRAYVSSRFGEEIELP